MTPEQATAYTRRVFELDLRGLPKAGWIGGRFLIASTERADLLLRVLEKAPSRDFRASGFLRMLQSPQDYEAMYSAYVCSEIWDHAVGGWVPLTEQYIEQHRGSSCVPATKRKPRISRDQSLSDAVRDLGRQKSLRRGK